MRNPTYRVTRLQSTPKKISSTPSFIVNDDLTIAGNKDYDEFAELLSAYGA